MAWVAAAAGGLSLLWLVLATGFANLSRVVRPEAALSVSPWDAGAMAQMSDEALTSSVSTSTALASATWAQASLRRDPTSVVAWRNLGLSQLMLGRIANGQRILGFAERLSRRDAGVQLTLLEAAVQRGDIAAALTHYDLIFRVSPSRDPLLMPILVAASADPPIRAQLIPLLRRSPAWRRRFFSALIAAPPAPADAATLVEQLAVAGALSDTDIFAAMATNLGLSGQDAAAWRVYAVLRRKPAAPIRNGDFEDTAPIAPFDWLLEGSGPITAALTRSKPGQRLEMTSSQGDGGPGARQLLALRPGAYLLTFDAGAIEGTDPATIYWQLRCGRDGAILLTGAARPAGVAAGFAVPASGCGGQWLELGFRAEGSEAVSGAWFDRFTITTRN